MPGEATTVGEIIAYLRMDRSDYSAGTKAAGREADELGRKNPRITITTNAGEAIAQIEAVAAASDSAVTKSSRSSISLAAAQRALATSADRVTAAQQRLASAQDKARAAGVGTAADYQKVEDAERSLVAAMRSHETAADRVVLAQQRLNAESVRTGRGMGLLATAIVGLGPALVPLTAVAVGGLAGLVATAGTAVLVIAGVSQEMKQGTQIGQAYKANLNGLSGEFSTLKTLAAAGALGGFQAGVRALQPLFPTLNRDVALFSTELGQIVGHTAPGLVSLFHQLNPLFTTLGQSLVDGSSKFQRWAASSDAVSKFVAYVQTELPQAEHVLAELIQTVGHLAAGFAPLGGSTLTTIGLLSRAINAIPLPVLQVLIPLLTSTALGIKGFKVASEAAQSLGGLSSKLAATGGAAAGLGGVLGSAATGLKTMGIVGLAAGPVLGLLVSWLGKQKQAQQEAQQAVNDYTQALVASNGAIDANVKNLIAKKLSDDGAYASGLKLGVNQKVVTDALLGSTTALAQVNAATKAGSASIAQYSGNYANAPKSVIATRDAINNLNTSLASQSDDLAKAKQEAIDQIAATEGVAAAAGLSSNATKAQAAALGQTVDQYIAGRAAADKNTQSIQAQTAAMQDASDAAGLLKNALDILNGKTLDVMSAQTSLASSNLNVTDSLKQNGSAVNGVTKAAVANQQVLQQQVTSAQQVAEAIGKQTGSSTAAIKSYKDSKSAIEAQLIQQKLLTPALQAYIDKLYDIKNLKVPPTKIDADTAAAQAKAAAFKAFVATLPKSIRTVVSLAGVSAAEYQLQLLARNRTAQITVVTGGQGASGVHSVGGVQAGEGHAKGGYITGPGTGTSDSIPAVGPGGRPIALSNGEEISTAASTRMNRAAIEAGNRGAKLAVVKQGYAAGGLVGDYAGTAPAAKTKKAKAKAAKPVQVSITATAGGGAAYGIASYIKGQIPSAAQAAKQLSAAVNDTFTLKGIQGQIASVKADLANLQQEKAQYSGNVSSSLLGQVDVTKYGSAGGLINALSAGRQTTQKFTGEEQKLAAEKLPPGLIQLLTQNGPNAGLDTVAAASGNDLKQIVAQYQAYVAAGQRGGGIAGNAVYGSAISSDQAKLNALNAQAARYESAINRLVAEIGQEAKRSVQIKLDGKVIATAVISSGQFQGVIDGLTGHLVYGRR